MMTTIRMPDPSARPRKIRSPIRTLAFLDGSVEMGVGSGKGDRNRLTRSRVRLDSVVVTSTLSVIGLRHPSSPRSVLSRHETRQYCVDGLQQALLEGVRQRNVARRPTGSPGPRWPRPSGTTSPPRRCRRRSPSSRRSRRWPASAGRRRPPWWRTARPGPAPGRCPRPRTWRRRSAFSADSSVSSTAPAAAVDLRVRQAGLVGEALLHVADRTGGGLDGLHDTGGLLRALTGAALELLARALGPRLRRRRRPGTSGSCRWCPTSPSGRSA